MAFDKEREPQRKTPEGVTEHIDEIPEGVEALEGVKRTVTAYNKQVTDDAGNNLTQSSDNQVVSIVIPTDDKTLAANSKGDSANAITWLSVFWQRIIKKALHFGWKITRGEKNNNDL